MTFAALPYTLTEAVPAAALDAQFRRMRAVTSEVTAEAIANYGVLPQGGIDAARDNALPTPVAGGQPQYEDEVICPNCHQGFAP
jgi:hypothetical protein